MADGRTWLLQGPTVVNSRGDNLRGGVYPLASWGRVCCPPVQERWHCTETGFSTPVPPTKVLTHTGIHLPSANQ